MRYVTCHVLPSNINVLSEYESVKRVAPDVCSSMPQDSASICTELSSSGPVEGRF